MVSYQHVLNFHTKGRSILDITDPVADVVSMSACREGLCNVFIQHTSASLIICENADPVVREDLESFMKRWIPDGDSIFKHVAEGPDDMPAHLRSIMTSVSLMIPVKNRQLLLGVWQGIYLWEHRTSRFHRKIVVTVQGNE